MIELSYATYGIAFNVPNSERQAEDLEQLDPRIVLFERDVRASEHRQTFARRINVFRPI
jgi:hypothetical protein